MNYSAFGFGILLGIVQKAIRLVLVFFTMIIEVGN